MFVAEFLLAGEGREIHGLLLGSTAYEDLHYVEALLGLEFLELKHELQLVLFHRLILISEKKQPLRLKKDFSSIKRHHLIERDLLSGKEPHLQKNIVSLRAFERPLAIAEGCIFMRIIRTLHDIAATRHVILAISRTVQLVGIIAAVVLFVALERRVDALAVRAMERTCGCIIVTGLSFCPAREISAV